MMLPHARTARLLTDVVRREPGLVEGMGRIPANHPLVVNERAPCFLGIEIGAQAVAAAQSLDVGAALNVSGRLVRIREATFLVPDLPVDVPLRAFAELDGASGPLSIYRIRLTVDGIDVLRATITVTATAAESSTTGAAPV